MVIETALNLQLRDEIEWLPDEWWTVIAHSLSVDAPAPVTMELRSVADPEFFSFLMCEPSHPFNCRRICGH